MYVHKYITHEEILKAAKLSELAYKKQSEIPENFEGLDLLKFVDNGNTEMCIFKDAPNNTIYVAFRGSSEFNDFLAYATFVPRSFMNTVAHRGFTKAFLEVKQDMVDVVSDSVKYGGDSAPKIILTGHSLGGSLANLALYFFLAIDYKNAWLVSFGAPKVFYANKLTAIHDEFKKRAIRICFSDDAVTNMPPVTPIMKLFKRVYTHIGQHWSMGIKNASGQFNDHKIKGYISILTEEVKNHENV